jgi:hypothetical protein
MIVTPSTKSGVPASGRMVSMTSPSRSAQGRVSALNTSDITPAAGSTADGFCPTPLSQVSGLFGHTRENLPDRAALCRPTFAACGLRAAARSHDRPGTTTTACPSTTLTAAERSGYITEVGRLEAAPARTGPRADASRAAMRVTITSGAPKPGRALSAAHLCVTRDGECCRVPGFHPFDEPTVNDQGAAAVQPAK